MPLVCAVGLFVEGGALVFLFCLFFFWGVCEDGFVCMCVWGVFFFCLWVSVCALLFFSLSLSLSRGLGDCERLEVLFHPKKEWIKKVKRKKKKLTARPCGYTLMPSNPKLLLENCESSS